MMMCFSASLKPNVMECLSALFQKWQCVEDPTGKLRLYKCKGMAGLFAPRMQALMARGASHLQMPPTSNSDGCNCDDVGFKTSFLKRKKLLTKKSMFLLSLTIVLVVVINRTDYVLKDGTLKCPCRSLVKRGH